MAEINSIIDVELNAVIDLEGNILRFGYCDFTKDGSFNTENEIMVQGCPHPFKRNDGINTSYHKYINGEWAELDQSNMLIQNNKKRGKKI